MTLGQLPWALWRAQILAILRLEMKKTFITRRGLWIYFLAFAPVLLFAYHSFVELKAGRTGDLGEDTHIFAAVFQFFFLRLAIFFGCMGIFVNLFRGEVVEKSLHYYFLAPLRREVLVAGKFLSGLLAAVVIFGTSTFLQFVAIYCYFSSNTLQEYLFHGHGIEHLVAYLGVTLLACVGYGSVFLAAGLLFRNPLIPTVFVLVWEAVNGFLPGLLQKVSVIFYLKSLCPVSIPEAIALDRGNPLALIAVNPAPASPATAILGLLILCVLVLALSSLQVHRMQIEYGTD
jgi:ABC-type transport system involved in multi-copper enzyme maturation permease subunit